jgi:hypothetical protein
MNTSVSSNNSSGKDGEEADFQPLFGVVKTGCSTALIDRAKIDARESIAMLLTATRRIAAQLKRTISTI